MCYLDDCFILAKICFLFSKLWKHSEKHSPYNSFSLINTQFTGRAYLKKKQKLRYLSLLSVKDVNSMCENNNKVITVR